MSSSVVAGLLCMMVLHQIVPAYARSQTVFGGGLPMVTGFTQSTRLPIATVGHEFSEVPYYLKRTDIFNRIANDPAGLRTFVEENPESFVITPLLITTEQLRDQMDAYAQVSLIAERGPARLHRVTRHAPTARITQRQITPENSSSIDSLRLRFSWRSRDTAIGSKCQNSINLYAVSPINSQI